MSSLKDKLMATSVVPALVGAGVAAAGIAVTPAAEAPSVISRTATAPAPAAVAKPAPSPTAAPVRLAACGACGAAKGCGACGACGACGPCGGGSAALTDCVVEIAANPCAAGEGCGACGACSAAKGCGACGTCGAAKSCGACGACGAAKGCGACGPCGASEAVTVSPAAAKEAYDCAKDAMTAVYAKSGIAWAETYGSEMQYNTRPYVSDTHGARYVNNYGNEAGHGSYIQFDALSEKAPAGAKFAKDSFTVDGQGRVAIGPLFLMEKMEAGFSADSRDWKYTIVMPDGSVGGVTGGPNAGAVEFCYGCHLAAEDNDSLFFMPEDVRIEN